MQAYELTVRLRVQADSNITADDIQNDVRDQLSRLQEQKPYRAPDGASWWMRSVDGASVIPTALTVAVFDATDAISIVRALRDVVAPDVLRIVAQAEMVR